MMRPMRLQRDVCAYGTPLILVLCPVLVTYIVLQYFLSAIPIFDDYQALILFSVQYLHTPGFLAKTAFILHEQHDEYKLIFEHVLFGMDLSLLGHLHYRLYAALGNLFLLPIGYLYWKEFIPAHPLRNRMLLFAPVTFLMFQLNYVETLDWAMCGLQVVASTFFALLTIWLLVKPGNPAFFGALASAVLTVAASANGFLLLPVGLLVLFLERRPIFIPAWLATFGALVFIYFRPYHSTPRDIVLPHPTLAQRCAYFLSFSGGAVENLHHFPFRGASIIAGFAIALAFAHAVTLGRTAIRPFQIYAAGWILLSAALVATIRIRSGMESSLVMHYKIFSDLLLVFTYIYAVAWVLNRPATVKVYGRRLYASALALSMMCYISSLYFGGRFLNQRRHVETAAFSRYLHDPSHPSPLVDLYGQPALGGDAAKVWIDEAIAEGIYIPPDNL